jgi:hypothetical protein
MLTMLNPLNAELNPICHLLALLGGATIIVVSRLRVNLDTTPRQLNPRERDVAPADQQVGWNLE